LWLLVPKERHWLPGMRDVGYAHAFACELLPRFWLSASLVCMARETQKNRSGGINMATTPTKQSSKINNDDGRIHTFGYHLAKKLLGERQINGCIRLAYEQQQQHAAEDPKDNPSTTTNFPCFRANWRSNVRFPWHLPSMTTANPQTNSNLDNHDGDNTKSCCGSCAAEALFVDVTFDLIFYPREVVDESRTKACYVLQYTDLFGLSEDTDRQTALDDYFALSIAVRIGAMVATSSSSSSSSNAIARTTSKESIGDGYEYYYIRGTNNVLTMSDLDEHCKSIQIILEEMDIGDVARIVGDAFLEGCSSESFWQVMTTTQQDNAYFSLTADEERQCESSEDLVSKCIVSNESKQQWYLKLHHKGELQADGLLPVSSNCEIMPIGQSMLDMILLQSNYGGVYTSVPINEALLLWKIIDPSIVKATEKPVEPSPRKLSPARSSSHMTAVSQEVATGDNNPIQQQQHQPTNHQKKTKSNGVVHGSSKASTRPQETALFARGKSTTLGGSRKKPKFTLGPKKE
jgi:hypothetical protein